MIQLDTVGPEFIVAGDQPDYTNYRPTETSWGVLDPATNQPRYRAMETPENLPFSSSVLAEMPALPSLTDLWNKVELAITPESEGERLVNQIYGRDENGVPITPPNAPLPVYDPQELSTPAIVIAAKNTVTKAGEAIKDTVIKYGFILFAGALALIVVYAFAGAYGRKLAS